jgi:hypothetical protein
MLNVSKIKLFVAGKKAGTYASGIAQLVAPLPTVPRDLGSNLGKGTDNLISQLKLFTC